MAHVLMLRLILVGFTFTLAESQSGYDGTSEMLACHLTSRLQRVESNADAYIGAILDHEHLQGEYDGAISCLLKDQSDKMLGYVPFSIVVQHDPPTELTVHVPMALREKLESLTMICRYADIGPELHVDNIIPESAKKTLENGEYQCGEGSNFKIVLKELLENPAKPRLKRYVENIKCSRFGINPYSDKEARSDVTGYCLMHNGTQGVYMYTESNGFECSRCCENHFFNKNSWKMVCEACPPGTHTNGYSHFGYCYPDVNIEQMRPSIQFKPLVNRTTTSLSVEWALSEEGSLIDHYQVVLERQAYSSQVFQTKETQLNIIDLTPDTSYDIVVTAVSAQKRKNLKSNILKLDTLFEVPSVEFLNVTVSKDQVIVTWTRQPKLALMLVLNCSLEKSKISCDDETVGHIVSDSDCRFVLRLSCGGVYNLKAHYYDSTYKRHGPESDVFKFTVKGRPKHAPTELLMTSLNTTSTRLAWKGVPAVEGNPVKCYTLYYGKDKSNMESVIRTKSNKTSWELEYLTSDTLYEVYVSAVNSEGEGPFSVSLRFRTLFEIPKIMNIKLQQSSNKIEVSWKSQEDFDLVVQTKSFLADEISQDWYTPDKQGKFDFNLAAEGRYHIEIRYFDEKNNRSGPLSYDARVEFSASGVLSTAVGVIASIFTVFGGFIFLILDCLKRNSS